MIKDNVLECINDTPLIRLHNIEKHFDLKFSLFIKLERNNPSGSIKDRAAKEIILDALKKNKINKETLIIEATSGNMGISLALICASLNLNLVIVMPENSSIERRIMMKELGAKLILTKKEEGMEGAVKLAKKLHKEIENSYYPNQFDNLNNLKAHYKYTSKEILKDLNNDISVFAASFGTSGTLIGCAKRFKKLNKDIKIIGIEPKESPLVSEGKIGQHKIQGIGANFIPKLFNKELVDEVIKVSSLDAYKYMNLLAKKEGLLVGISSGANLGIIDYLKDKKEYYNKNVVTILPDNFERYLSVEGVLIDEDN